MPVHGGLDGEGREVALVDLEWESDEDVEESDEDGDESPLSSGERGLVYTILRGALEEGTGVSMLVVESAVDMRRVVGCMKEGVGSMSIGGSRSNGVI